MPDVELALHCISGLGSVNTPSCPIIAERTLAMSECEGRRPSDIMFGFLVEAVKKRNALEPKMEREPRPKRQHEIDYEVWTAHIASISYCVAVIRNPYNPDPEGVLALAEMEASDA